MLALIVRTNFRKINIDYENIFTAKISGIFLLLKFCLTTERMTA